MARTPGAGQFDSPADRWQGAENNANNIRFAFVRM